MEKILSTSNLYEPDITDVISKIDRFVAFDGDVNSAIEVFESSFAQYHNSKYCISFSTGFWALVASIIAKSDDGRNEVIMPSLTYRRLADAVYWAGKIPVFVDIDPENLAISPDSIKKNISNESSLILAVHPIVNCCDVENIIKISESYGIPLLFDAVESVHETINGKRIGSFGAGEVFSMHASKLLNGLEGGYVCTDDKKFKDDLILFRDGQYLKGTDNSDSSSGMNFSLHGFHALFGLSSLSEVETNVAHNRNIYNSYRHELNDIEGIRLLAFNERDQTSYKNIVVEVLDNYPLSRDSLLEMLNKNNVLARSYYSIPLHEKKTHYPVKITDLTHTIHASTRFLNLPCGYRVTDSDVTYVCNLIRGVSNG